VATVTHEKQPCKPCAHADKHSWWGQPGTHCRDCHTSWTGTAPQHCTVCHNTFAGGSAADAHFGQKHVDPELVEKLELRDDGLWSIRALESV